ncbi:hypothetical protein H0H92_008495 [Tricholoma furcatifolium]|nr:hypothetical protein H0H92_008495 [Tricholoma furcatifolium]
MSTSNTDYTAQVDNSGWSASLYNKTASFVYSSAFTTPVLDLLAAKPGERIVDFGCGSAEVTLRLQKLVASAPGGLVVGTDFSESMITKAKENGLEHAFVGDIQALELPDNIPTINEKFDAVFSNATIHWCKRDPAGVLESAKKVLKPGGRFVAETGGFLNCVGKRRFIRRICRALKLKSGVGLRSAMHEALRKRGYDPVSRDPWFFPSVEDYEKLLTTAGFQVKHISLNPRITPLIGGAVEWLQLFARHSFMGDLSDEEAKEIIEDAAEICRVDCQDKSGKWSLMYVRLRFVAVIDP